MSQTGSGKDQDSLTRKQRRDQAREQRKATERAQAAAATRRRRIIQLGGVAAVVVVAIVVIVVATGGKGAGKETAVPKTSQARSEVVTTVTSLLNGIPQSGTLLGSPSAPVKMRYFGDLECPICAEFTLDALPSIIANDVRTGKLKIEYESFSTATGNAERLHAEPEGMFTTQQVAAYAAGRQNRAWYYIELFYHEQGKEDSGYVTESFLQSLASQVPGLNLQQWSAARNDKALETRVIEGNKEAINLGFEGTPSFTIGKSSGPLKPFSPESIKSSTPFEEMVNKLAT